MKIIQVDINAEELGQNGGSAELSLLGDIALTVEQINSHLGKWQWKTGSNQFYQRLQAAQKKNLAKAAQKAKVVKTPMMFEQAFDVIKLTLDGLSKPEDGDIV